MLLTPSQVTELEKDLNTAVRAFMICFSMYCLLVSCNHFIASHLKTLPFTKRKAHKIKATEIRENCLFCSEYTGDDPQSQTQQLKANVKGFIQILTPRTCIFLIACGFLQRSKSLFFPFPFGRLTLKQPKSKGKAADATKGCSGIWKLSLVQQGGGCSGQVFLPL